MAASTVSTTGQSPCAGRATIKTWMPSWRAAVSLVPTCSTARILDHQKLHAQRGKQRLFIRDRERRPPHQKPPACKGERRVRRINLAANHVAALPDWQTGRSVCRPVPRNTTAPCGIWLAASVSEAISIHLSPASGIHARTQELYIRDSPAPDRVPLCASVIRCANGWVASRTAVIPASCRYVRKPSAPPKPPIRVGKDCAAGVRVAPASEITASCPASGPQSAAPRPFRPGSATSCARPRDDGALPVDRSPCHMRSPPCRTGPCTCASAALRDRFGQGGARDLIGLQRCIRLRSHAALPRSSASAAKSTWTAPGMQIHRPLRQLASSCRCRHRWSPAPPDAWRDISASRPRNRPCPASHGRAGRRAPAPPVRVAPVQPATWVSPAARATSMPRWIEAIQAAQENGRTIPVVPRIDSPPSIPSRGFQVFAASSAPPGTETLISTSGRWPNCAAISSTTPAIIWRGTGLIAGSPGRSAGPAWSPCRRPSPALKDTPRPARPHRDHDQRAVGHIRIVARILGDPHLGPALTRLGQASANTGVSPRGKVILTSRRKRAAPQPHQRRLDGGGGAGPRGPAPAQLCCGLVVSLGATIGRPAR